METVIIVEYVEQAQLICNKLFDRYSHYHDHHWFITAEEDNFSIECKWFDQLNYAKSYAEGFYDAIKEV
jgi:hypothetical protein